MRNSGLVLEALACQQHGIHKIFPVSAHLSPGRWHVLLGKTGAGKTTLMRLIAGLEPASSGVLYLNGQDITHKNVRTRSIAMVYQQFINYPAMSVYENIASPLRLSSLSGNEIDKRVREMADLLKISPFLDRNVLELSGGQQQRTSLARALVKEADILLLDEPLVNLDYKLREDLRADLPDLLAKRQTIIMYATTEPHEALVLGGHTFLMKQGRLLQTGNAVDIYHQPKTLEAAQAYSDPPMNILDVQIQEDQLVLDEQHHLQMQQISHEARLPAGKYYLGVRAHQLSVIPKKGFVPLTGVITLIELTGSDSFIHMHLFGKDWVVQAQGVHTPEIGQSFQIFLNPTSLYLFDMQGVCLVTPPYKELTVLGGQDGAH